MLYTASGCDHWMALVLLEPGSIGRAQVEQFVAGAALQTLPFLWRMVARLFFASVAERSVEALHARSKRWFQLATHSSVVHLAFFGMLPHLRGAVAADPDLLEKLALYCSALKNPLRAVTEMGFTHHPVVSRIVQQCGARVTDAMQRQFKTLVKVLLHIDPETIYGDLPALPEAGDGGGGPGGRGLGDGPCGGADGDGPGGGDDEGGDGDESPGGPGGDLAAEGERVLEGGVVEMLWREAVVQELSEMTDHRISDGQSPPVLSLGPHLSSNFNDIAQRLSTFTNPVQRNTQQSKTSIFRLQLWGTGLLWRTESNTPLKSDPSRRQAGAIC